MEKGNGWAELGGGEWGRKAKRRRRKAEMERQRCGVVVFKKRGVVVGLVVLVQW